ncbi:hypothetical protein J1TS5_46540 [Paenibacillus macerans]|nr:hypothetical protein J1TS5_46540 [Paenibacillus macerans]
MRATNNILKLLVTKGTMFDSTNTPNTSSITFFRLNLENIKGMTGPDMAMPKAKRLTSSPA